MTFMPPKPGPITRLKNEIIDHLLEDNWVDFCRFVRAQDKAMLSKLIEFLLGTDLIDSNIDLNRLTLRDIYWHIELARSSSPIVEYIVERELADSLATSSLPDSDMTVEDAFRLPYGVVAIRIAERPKTAYNLYAIDDGDMLVTGADGHFSKESLLSPMSSIYPRSNIPKECEFRTQLGVLAYLVHGKDTQETRIENRGSSKKSRNKTGCEVVRGVVGGRFASTYRVWSKTQSVPQDGTHASPRPHLRAGHWHLYWTGEGRTIPKVNFVHPCLVNSDEVGDVEIQRTIKA